MQNYFSIQLLRVVKSSLWLTSNKIPRTMRLFILFLICSMSFVHATDVFAQKVEISIDIHNQTVEKVLKEIEKQSGFGFFFNNKHVNLKRMVSVSVDKSDIFKVLDEIFEGTNVKYSVLDKKIILSTEMTSKQQQTVRVSGRVTDVNGEPVIGASVVEKGTTNGIITNLEGEFSLSVSSEKAVIEISYIGYQTQELKVVSGKPLSVTMKEDTRALEEVVVVGYGSQKKVNVIGSIAAVDSKKLESRTAPSVSNMLTGQLSGVTITQSSGNPGQDQGTIRVRGVGSFGATPDPLVLVDGLPGSLNDLNPADIESISILKDASSAAIYGSRAANGVVLVKTKGGQKGKVTVSYNGYVGFNQATELPEMCDSWEYAELYNKAMGKEVYTAEEIQKYKDGSDPYNYPNEHYLDKLLGNKGLQTGHELTVNGGNDKTQYMVSFGYVKQNGLMKHNHYDRYNGRVNLTTELAKNLTLTTRLGGVVSKRSEPSTPGGMDSAGFKAFSSNALRFPGLWATKLEDGSSKTKISGSPADTDAQAIFCFSPPDK